jgi:hypothetical protein
MSLAAQTAIPSMAPLLPTILPGVARQMDRLATLPALAGAGPSLRALVRWLCLTLRAGRRGAPAPARLSLPRSLARDLDPADARIVARTWPELARALVRGAGRHHGEPLYRSAPARARCGEWVQLMLRQAAAR